MLNDIDLIKMEKGNISLPKSLQSPDVEANDYPAFNKEEMVTIVNMQRTLYQVKIEDLENRIKRLENRNQTILDEYSSTNSAFVLKDRETADEIMTINQEISREIIKIKSDQNEIQKVEQLRLENKAEHEKNIKTLQNMYKQTRIDLKSKIKTLNARINSLQEFKDNKQQLSEKLAKNSELIQENENVYKINFNEIDRKFKIAKEKMKNELHGRLLILAQDFQIEMMGRLSPSTQRLIRENIIIQNDSSQLFNDNVFKEAQNLEMQYAAEMCDNQLKEKQRKTFLKLITCKIQENLISTIKSQNNKLKKTLTTSKQILQSSQENQKEFFQQLKIEENLDFQRRKLQVALHHAQVKIKFALNKQRQSELTVKKLTQILDDITFTVFSALNPSESDEDTETMTFKQLLHSLMNRLTPNKSESRIEAINSMETVFSINTHETNELVKLQYGNNFFGKKTTSFLSRSDSFQNVNIKNSTVSLKNTETDSKKRTNSEQLDANSMDYDDLKIWNLEQDEETEYIGYLSEKSDN